jgi:Tfp pilus assembly protein PilO
MSPRVWRIGGIAGAVLVLVVAWLLVISPTMQDAAALDEETASQQAASAELESRISLLKKQSEELPAQEAVLAEIQQRMPPTAALPTLIRNLTTVAENANVVVASVTPGLPAPVAQPVAAAPPPQDGANDSEEPADTEGSDATSSTAAAPVAPAGPQAEAMTVNIAACGTFAQLRNYLRELESMKRVMLVSSVSVARGSCAEGSAEDDLTATIGAFVFTLPNAIPASIDVAAGPVTDPTAATEGS